jgi:hypothetical protein
VADVRSVVYAVSPVAVIADIIPASFTWSTSYFSRSLFKASVPRSHNLRAVGLQSLHSRHNLCGMAN